jgi:Spy/CpxP family protein refolding chaperone
MLRFASCLALLLLLFGIPLSAAAFETDHHDPLDQYQMDFKRKHLSSSLGLDQARVERLLQIDQKYKSLKREKIREAKATLRQLQQLMQQPNPPQQQVEAILDRMMKLRREKLALEQKQLQEEKNILTPVQQARYILLLMNMRQQIAREAQMMRSSPQGVPVPPQTGPREVPVSRPGGPVPQAEAPVSQQPGGGYWHKK